MLSDATFRDYAWVDEDDLFGGFCLTFVENASVQDVITGLPVVERLGPMSFETLCDRSHEAWARAFGPPLTAGLAEVDGWTMMYEANGFAGIANSVVAPLSGGRRVISHYYSDGNGHGRFVYYRDGSRVAEFDPLFAAQELTGAEPADFVRSMRAVGFDFRVDEDGGHQADQHFAAVFALCERSIGFPITRELITGETYEVVTVAVPGGPRPDA